MNKLRNGVYRGLCLFFHDSLPTESSDFKSARCQASIFGTLEILAFQNKNYENNLIRLFKRIDQIMTYLGHSSRSQTEHLVIFLCSL